MSYSDLISESSPKYYFRFDNGTVQNTGSDNVSISTGTSTTFPTTGGILNSGRAVTTSYSDGNYGLQVTQTSTYISDKVFTVSGWFKVASADLTTSAHHILRTAQNTSEGIVLIKSGGNMVLYATIGNTQVGGGEGTSPSLAYDVWHHFAVTCDTSNLKLYIDGSLIDTQTAPSTTPADGIQYWFRYTGSSNRYGVKGQFDEMALFDSTLSATTIASHYNYVNGANISATALTASSLFVNPAVSADKNVNPSAPALTASADIGDVQVSNFNVVPSLNTLLLSQSLNQYIRFESSDLFNSGTEGNSAWDKTGSNIFKTFGGVSSEPSLLTTGRFYRNSGSIIDDFVNDNVGFGIWIKTEDADFPILNAIYIDESYQPIPSYSLGVNIDGYVTATITSFDEENAEVNTSINGDLAVNDGEWHFVAFRFNGDILSLYVDNNLQGTESGISSVGTRQPVTFISFGPDGIATAEFASMIVDTYTKIGTALLQAVNTLGNYDYQAYAYMPNPEVKISTAFYDKAESLGAVLNFKLDGAGVPVSTINNGLINLSLASSSDLDNVTYGYPAKNVNAYRIEDTNTSWAGAWGFEEGSFTTNNEWSVSALVKIDPTKLGSEDIPPYGIHKQFIIIGGNSGNNLGLGYTNDHWYAYASEQDFFTELTLEGTSSLDDKWHLLTATFDGTYVKLYVDGIEEASQDTSTYYDTNPYVTADNGYMYVLGGENFFYGETPSTNLDKIVDHLGVFDYALSAQEVFEFWQSVGVDPMLATNATFELPVGIAGFGPTINPGVMYVSAQLPDPTQQDTINNLAIPLTAFAAFANPNFAATSNVNHAASVLTASVEAGNVQWSVGEFNTADHMSASAVFVDPQVFIPGFYNANPMIATNARLVDPGFTSTQGGLVKPDPMRASAVVVLPPAYKSLFDDKWYDILYSQHSQKNNVRVVNGGNGEAILKLFDDVTSSISLATPINSRIVTNNLTKTITTDGIVVDETSPTMSVFGEFNPSTNTPIISTGHFDDYERKAVRFNNITTGYENSEYSNFSFSFELSVKTTKSDQIIAYGKTRSFYGYQQYTTSYGLSDGKLFLKSTAAIGPAPISHYKETTVGTSLLGNKRIDDGQWHHIVIQMGWDDNRVQFWIDGELDIQRIGGWQRLDGPSFLGFNSQTATYASDFYTSAWSYDSNRFILDQEVDNHRYAFIKYEPVRAAVMTASAVSGDHLAAGNRGRALMLYWWPTDSFQNPPLTVQQYNKGREGFSDVETFTNELTTADFIKNGPQEYYGWDIFPVDITGYYVSELVKPESYGGKEHIKKGSKPFIGTGQNYNTNPEFLYNDQGTFRDPVTDDARYIDLVNDIDLRNFDAIFFKNFPDDSIEKDSYTTNEVVDTYFGLKEATLYESFLKSLRGAVDAGVSLYITNPQLAIDLGIVDRVESVPDMDDLAGFESDPYSLTIVPSNAVPLSLDNAAKWYDSNKNNRLRIVNELEGFTTEPSFIYTDYAYYLNDDANQFGGPNRPFARYVYRPDGLRVGDEFIIANDKRGGSKSFLATPFANVKSGTIITAFGNNVRRGLDLIQNPYRNYATTIVVKPGDILNGTQSGGRIVVNFTENLNGAVDWGDVDLVTDYWINVAYDDGFIDLATKNTLLAAPYNLDRQLENEIISQAEYDKLTYWSSNGMYVLSEGTIIDDPTASSPKSGLGKGERSGIVTKTRKSGTSYSAKVTTSSQWFSFSYSYQYPRMGIKVPNILTRGFWWLSNRESYNGTINRPVVATANAVFVNPVVAAQRDNSITASSMVASARIVQSVGTNAASVNYAPLPMTASAAINGYVTRYVATPMIASAVLRTNNIIFTTAVDEVVVYVYHTDPILYLREDVIK